MPAHVPAKRVIGLGAAILFYCSQVPGSEDIQVHCRGQGPSLYLIGGGPAFTTWNLQPIQDRLSDGYRVCRWDMRGVGDNAGLPVKPGVSALAQWLDDMNDVLPPAPVTLWGHSWGALQVLLFARQYPERVSSLILSNPVDPALRSLEHIERKRFVHPENHGRLALEDMGTPAEDLHNLRSKVASYFVDAEQGWAYASGFTGADANNRLNVRVWDDYRQTPLSESDVRRAGGQDQRRHLLPRRRAATRILRRVPAPLGRREASRPGRMRPLPVGGESASLLCRPGASAPGPVGLGGACCAFERARGAVPAGFRITRDATQGLGATRVKTFSQVLKLVQSAFPAGIKDRPPDWRSSAPALAGRQVIRLS